MSTAEALAAMMTTWNKVEAAAREQFPAASDEETYQTTKATMDQSLALPNGN